MFDLVLDTFLRLQHHEGQALTSESDLVSIQALERDRFLLRFACTGLVKQTSGEIIDHTAFLVGVWFPEDYLRRADPFQVVRWLGPSNVFHPNIAGPAGAICLGRLTPGTSLVDIAYQAWEVITYRKVTMREDDALDHVACQWARANQDRLPLDRRSLKRRVVPIELVDIFPEPPHASR